MIHWVVISLFTESLLCFCQSIGTMHLWRTCLSLRSLHQQCSWKELFQRKGSKAYLFPKCHRQELTDPIKQEDYLQQAEWKNAWISEQIVCGVWRVFLIKRFTQQRGTWQLLPDLSTLKFHHWLLKVVTEHCYISLLPFPNPCIEKSPPNELTEMFPGSSPSWGWALMNLFTALTSKGSCIKKDNAI